MRPRFRSKFRRKSLHSDPKRCVRVGLNNRCTTIGGRRQYLLLSRRYLLDCCCGAGCPLQRITEDWICWCRQLIIVEEEKESGGFGERREEEENGEDGRLLLTK